MLAAIKTMYCTCDGLHFMAFEKKAMSPPRIYEHLGRNPGIIYWQIRQPVTMNMCTSYWIVSPVA